MTLDQKYEAARKVLAELVDAVAQMPIGQCSRRLIETYGKAAGVLDGLNFVENIRAKDGAG